MRGDSGANRGTDKSGNKSGNGNTGQGTSQGTGRTRAPSRARQASFPFWVIRGARAQASRATQRAPTTPEREGRTGVDLRAAGGAARREPLSGPRPKLRKRVPLLSWRSAKPPEPASVNVSAPMAATMGTVTEALAARRPRRRRVRVNVGLALLAAAQVVVVGLIAWGLTSPTWQVRYVQVEVEGTQDATLAAAIQNLPLTGCNIFRCDTARQTRMVEGLPAVASAQVHAAYPDGLIVVVSPRRPALLWQVDGQAFVVASDGTVLGTQASDPAYAKAVLPVVYDDESAAFDGTTPKAGANMPAVTAEMAGQLRSSMAAALGGSGWTLDYTADDGFVAVSQNGEQVIFGTPVDAASALAPSVAPATLGTTPDRATVDAGVRAQLDEVRSLGALLASKGQRASLIDVRWGAHPYYRLGG